MKQMTNQLRKDDFRDGVNSINRQTPLVKHERWLLQTLNKDRTKFDAIFPK